MYQKGSKSGPLELKSGSTWGAQFWPLHLGTYVAKSPIHACGKFLVEADLTQATSAAGVLNWGGPCYGSAFSYLFKAKKRTPYFYHFFNFYSRGRRDLLRGLPRVALKPAANLASS